MNIFKSSKQICVSSDGFTQTEIVRITDFNNRNNEFSSSSVRFCSLQLVNFNFNHILPNVNFSNDRLNFYVENLEYSILVPQGTYTPETLTDTINQCIQDDLNLPESVKNLQCEYNPINLRFSFSYSNILLELKEVEFLVTSLLMVLGFSSQKQHLVNAGSTKIEAEFAPDLAFPKKLYILLNTELNNNFDSKNSLFYFAEIPMAVSPGDFVNFTPLVVCEQIIPLTFYDTYLYVTVTTENFIPINYYGRFKWSLSLQFNVYNDIQNLVTNNTESLAAYLNNMTLFNSLAKRRRKNDGKVYRVSKTD